MTSHPAPSLCGLAKDKAELFRERYTILQQVSELFSLSSLQTGELIQSLCCHFQYMWLEGCIYTDMFFFCSEYIDMNSSPRLQSELLLTRVKTNFR